MENVKVDFQHLKRSPNTKNYQIQLQQFAINLNTQINHILSPIELISSHFDDKLNSSLNFKFKRHIISVLYPFIAYDFRKLMSQQFETYVHDQLTSEASNRETIITVLRELEGLDLLSVLEGDFVGFIQQTLEDMIQNEDISDDSKIEFYLNFLNTKIEPLLETLFGRSSTMDSWMHRLRYQTYRSLGLSLIANVFDIIRDYPSSHNALSDLKVFVFLIDLRRKIIRRTNFD